MLKTKLTCTLFSFKIIKSKKTNFIGKKKIQKVLQPSQLTTGHLNMVLNQSLLVQTLK